MMNYITNMNANLTMAYIVFGILAISSSIVMSFKAWQTLTIGEWCLAGDGEPDSEEISFQTFCYEMFKEPALRFISGVRSLLKSLHLVRTAAAVTAVSAIS